VEGNACLYLVQEAFLAFFAELRYWQHIRVADRSGLASGYLKIGEVFVAEAGSKTNYVNVWRRLSSVQTIQKTVASIHTTSSFVLGVHGFILTW
jgi:hypothetical protein